MLKIELGFEQHKLYIVYKSNYIRNKSYSLVVVKLNMAC